jgi:diguanylate cyclase (GGDEF)-like protein
MLKHQQINVTNELKYKKIDAIETLERNIKVLQLIVVLIVFTLLFINTRFLSAILDYIPLQSVITLLLIVSGLVIGVLYLVKKISDTAIRKLREYGRNIETLLISIQQEISDRGVVEEDLKKTRNELEDKVEERTSDLSNTVKTLKDQITERSKVEDKLKYQALYDQLTDLPNRVMFKRHLHRVITRPKRHKDYQFAILFMDVDRFKIVNDSLGHIMGDQLLVEVARRLEDCLRTTDTVARFGGDEFAILLDDINDATDAIRISDRIQNELSLPFNLNGQEVFTTASIGIAMSATGYNLEDDLIRDADAAMYRAKAIGRGRYEIFDRKIHTTAMNLLQLEADLWRAVENMEFLVHYQPIVSLTSGKITGVEALLRWKHPQRGYIPPDEFIPLAEEIGLISKIGEWLLRIACNQNKAWQDAGYGLLNMGVNFSARQFQYQDIPELIKEVIQQSGLAAQSLNIEITESIAMETHCIKILNELSAAGVQTSIDDFGTGYSSLGSIKRFPINTIKIDKSFIKDIPVDSNAKAIVKAIIAMAHSLKIKIIAEGVETEAQLAFLRANQCDEIQGYFCSPPLPVEEFNKLIEIKGIQLLEIVNKEVCI